MGAAVSTPVANIGAGSSLSNAVYIGHGRLVSIQVPSGWTTANLTFQGSYDGVNYFEILDYTGAAVVLTLAAGGNELASIGNQQYFDGALWMKVRSGTSGAPVNQVSAAALNLLVRKYPVTKMR